MMMVIPGYHMMAITVDLMVLDLTMRLANLKCVLEVHWYICVRMLWISLWPTASALRLGSINVCLDQFIVKP